MPEQKIVRAPRAPAPIDPEQPNTQKKVRLLAYGPVLVVAVLKDTLDLVLGWFPGVAFLYTLLFVAIIMLLLTIARDVTTTWKGIFLIRAALVLFPVLFVEGLANGVNLVPSVTLALLGLYWTEKMRTRFFQMLKAVV